MMVLSIAPIQAYSQQNVSGTPIFTVNLAEYLHQRTNLAQIVSVLDQHTLIIAESRLGDYSSINFWDMKTGKIKSQLALPTQIDSSSVLLSPDNSELLAYEDVLITPNSYYHPHKLFCWSMRTKKLIKTIDVGQNFQIYGAVLLSNSSNKAIVTVGPLPTGIGHILYINLTTAIVYNNIKYDYSVLMKRTIVIYSPNGKIMACVYPADEISPNRIDFLETKSGKILSVFHGDFNKHIVSFPIFSSPTHRSFVTTSFITSKRNISLLFCSHTTQGSNAYPMYPVILDMPFSCPNKGWNSGI